MILILYILTPFTMTYSIHLFQGFRISQTRMMLLAILHGHRPNLKLKSILEGCADLQHLWAQRYTPTTFFQTILPTSERLYSFHSHKIHATQILRGLCNAPYHGQRV